MISRKILLAGLLLIAANSFAQQTDMSLIPYRSGDKWGYATPDKKIVITPAYSDANWFSEGFASVKIGNKYGYINKQGKLVIPAKFTVAKPFRKGYMPDKKKEDGDSVLFAGASMEASGYEICIDAKGNRMPKCPAINESSASENATPIVTSVKEKSYSLPNSAGLFDKIVDDYKVPGNDETFYIALKGDKYGVFNSKFETIVPFQFNSIKINKNSVDPYLLVNQAGMFGLIMPDGKVTIAPEYTNLNVVKGPGGKEYVIIQKNGKTYVKDITNTDIISTGYSDIVYDNAGGFVITGDNNNRGFYFMDNSVIQPKYKEVKLLNGGKYLEVKTASGKKGYISNTGDEYFTGE
ncbi:MAG: WG repeat-containing protein [Ferruginibacter sp.]